MAVANVKKQNKKDEKLWDWHAKEAYLSAHFEQVEPWDFYTFLGLNSFEKGFKLCATHVNRHQGKRFRRYNDLGTLLKESQGRYDAYIYPASYYRSYVREKLMHSISCIYLDLDHVSVRDMERLFRWDFYGYHPTYIVDSGNGVHLVYELNETLATYNWVKLLLRRIHQSLLQAFARRGYQADMGTGISHAYRIIGSRTKLGQVCTAYRIGDVVSIEALAEAVGIRWQRPQDRKRRICPLTFQPNGKQHFYDATVKGIIEKTVEGHRYMSLFGLICVGYKCGVPFEKISQDVMKLAQYLHLPTKEAQHALDVCDPKKGIRVRATTLETWFGWEYERKTKRNGRTREEHLAWVAESRVKQTMRRIEGYLRLNLKATILEISKELKMSRNTIAKYIDKVREKLANIIIKDHAEAKTQAENTADIAVKDNVQMAEQDECSNHCIYTSPQGELCSVPVFKGQFSYSNYTKLQMLDTS